MLHIGINSLHIRWGVNAGTETYLTNIVKPWYEKQIQDLSFTLYCNQLPPWWRGDKTFFKIKLLPKAKVLPGRIFLHDHHVRHLHHFVPWWLATAFRYRAAEHDPRADLVHWQNSRLAVHLPLGSGNLPPLPL